MALRKRQGPPLAAVGVAIFRPHIAAFGIGHASGSRGQPPKQLVALLPHRRGLGTLGIARGLGPWQPGNTRQQSG